MRAVALTVAVLFAVLLSGCASSTGDVNVAKEWLPKLKEENAFVCKQNVCDTAQRRAGLTAELAADARAGGADYQAVAALADRANLAYRFWEADCYPKGTRSVNAGMSCDDAFDLQLYGTDQLEALLVQVAEKQQSAS